MPPPSLPLKSQNFYHNITILGPLSLSLPQHLPLPSIPPPTTPPPPGRPATPPPAPPQQPLPAQLLAIPPFFNNYNMPSNWTLVHRTKTDQCDLFYAPSYPVQHSIYLNTNLFCTHTCSLKVTSHTVNLSSDVHLYIKKSTHRSCKPFIVQAASPTPTLSIILPYNLSISTLSTSN
jgi:hypothetical protein